MVILNAQKWIYLKQRNYLHDPLTSSKLSSINAGRNILENKVC